MDRLRSAVLASLVLILAGCSLVSGSPAASTPAAPGGSNASGVAWVRPPDPMSLARQAGLTPDVKEFFAYHVHAHLDVFVDGHPVQVPGGIGIVTTDPAVKHFGSDGFGGIPPEGCSQACISPLHTHDVDGVIHIEAPAVTTFTLGQFFAELGVRLDAACVDRFCGPSTPIVVYLNGRPQSGNPADIPLADREEIAIVIGTPPPTIPDSFSGG